MPSLYLEATCIHHQRQMLATDQTLWIHYARSPLDPECINKTAGINLDIPIVEHKVDISGPLSIVAHEILISLRSFVLRVSGKHTLYTQASALNILDG